MIRREDSPPLLADLDCAVRRGRRPAVPGVISLFRPIDAAPPAIGMPYVVFAGDVGDDQALAQVVAILNGEPSSPTSSLAGSSGSWPAIRILNGAWRSRRPPCTT